MWEGIWAFFKGLAIALGMAEKKEQRNEGAIAQREVEESNELKNIRDGNAAASSQPVLDSVRHDYQIDRPGSSPSKQ